MTARPSRIAVHIALILYTILALGPIVLVLINAFKTRRAIFADPLGLPDGQTFTTDRLRPVSSPMPISGSISSTASR